MEEPYQEKEEQQEVKVDAGKIGQEESLEWKHVVSNFIEQSPRKLLTLLIVFVGVAVTIVGGITGILRGLAKYGFDFTIKYGKLTLNLLTSDSGGQEGDE